LQGAVALQAREDRPEVLAVLAAINHEATMLAVRAEREVQRLLAGDCSVPIGVRSEHAAGKLVLRGILFHADATEPMTATAEGEHPETVARALVAGLTSVARRSASSSA
jgi:hydroxymethylbilane synthase